MTADVRELVSLVTDLERKNAELEQMVKDLSHVLSSKIDKLESKIRELAIRQQGDLR